MASHGVLSLRPLRSLRLKHQSRVGSFSVEIAGIDPFDGCGFGRETALFDELE